MDPRSRGLCLSLLLSLLAIVVGISILAAQEVLTNAAIIEMVKARLSDELIITQIQNSGGNYSVGHRDVLSLKSQGVSDRILAAMQAKVKGIDAGGQPQPRRADGASGNWHVDDVADVMSGEKHFEGVRELAVPDASGNLKIVATCNAVSMQMDFTYFPEDNQTGFKQNWDGNTVTPGGVLGALVASSRHAKPWVEMRVKIDNNPPVTVSSENDYPNKASLMFFADPLQASTGQALSKKDPATGTVVGIMLAAKSAGSRDKAAEAHSIVVEFTLANGRQEIIQFEPRQPGFQAFASRCDDEFWTGPARRKAEEVAKKKAEEEARIRPIIVAKNNTVLGIQQPHGPAEDGFKFLYSLSWPDRQYTGTVEGFATQFPEFFKRAALASGIEVRDVDEKIAYVIHAVRTCAQITPELEMEKGAFQPNGRQLWGGRVGGTEALEKLGPQYEICKRGGPVPPTVTGASLPAKRGVYLYVVPVGDRWLDRKAFKAQVSFSGLDHDGDDLRGRLQPGADYTIILATIHP